MKVISSDGQTGLISAAVDLVCWPGHFLAQSSNHVPRGQGLHCYQAEPANLCMADHNSAHSVPAIVHLVLDPPFGI